MASAEIKNFATPDDSRPIPGGQVDTVTSPAGSMALGTLQPGWRWSKDIKPVVGTEWCEVEHFEYIVSGRITIHLKDGTEYSGGPGDIFYVPPGHDGWVVGDEPLRSISFGPSDFGKPSQ
jgi:hypothetical protein